MKLFSQPFIVAGSLVVASACGGIDLSTSAQTRPEGRFERTLTVSGPVDLSVRTGSGDVDIRIGTSDRVQVIGRITAGRRLENATERIKQIETAPPIQQTGNAIRIGDTNDDPRAFTYAGRMPRPENPWIVVSRGAFACSANASGSQSRWLWTRSNSPER